MHLGFAHVVYPAVLDPELAIFWITVLPHFLFAVVLLPIIKFVLFFLFGHINRTIKSLQDLLSGFLLAYLAALFASILRRKLLRFEKVLHTVSVLLHSLYHLSLDSLRHCSNHSCHTRLLILQLICRRIQVIAKILFAFTLAIRARINFVKQGVALLSDLVRPRLVLEIEHLEILDFEPWLSLADLHLVQALGINFRLRCQGLLPCRLERIGIYQLIII